MFFRCYTIEAAMEFFGMENVFDTPTKNRPNYAFMSLKEHRQRYFEDTLKTSSFTNLLLVMMTLQWYKVNL